MWNAHTKINAVATDIFMTSYYTRLISVCDYEDYADKSCNRQFKNFFTHDQMSLNYVHFQISSIISIDDRTWFLPMKKQLTCYKITNDAK